jgi:hypothetical protein
MDENDGRKTLLSVWANEVNECRVQEQKEVANGQIKRDQGSTGTLSVIHAFDYCTSVEFPKEQYAAFLGFYVNRSIRVTYYRLQSSIKSHITMLKTAGRSPRPDQPPIMPLQYFRIAQSLEKSAAVSSVSSLKF